MGRKARDPREPRPCGFCCKLIVWVPDYDRVRPFDISTKEEHICVLTKAQLAEERQARLIAIRPPSYEQDMAQYSAKERQDLKEAMESDRVEYVRYFERRIR